MGLGEKIFEELGEVDGIVLRGNSYRNQNLYYVTKFLESNDFLYVNVGGEEWMVVGGMSKERAMEESRVERIETKDSLGVNTNKNSGASRTEEIIKKVIEKSGGSVGKIGVLDRFPVGLYKKLSENLDVKVMSSSSPIERFRATKKQEEIRHIRGAQEAAARSIELVKETLAESEIKDGKVVFEGRALTSGLLRRRIEHSLVDEGMELVDCIVASGSKSSRPHYRGRNEDKIGAGEPLIVDVFPRSKESRYHGDMTRTFVKGEMDGKLKKMYEAVLEAQKKGMERVEPGIEAGEVRKMIKKVFEEHGLEDLVKGVGHGVGLDAHEKPTLREGNTYRLEEGNTLTVEPGLYDPEIGGVRIEDLVVVEDGGCEVLSPIDRSIKVE